MQKYAKEFCPLVSCNWTECELACAYHVQSMPAMSKWRTLAYIAIDEVSRLYSIDQQACTTHARLYFFRPSYSIFDYFWLYVLNIFEYVWNCLNIFELFWIVLICFDYFHPTKININQPCPSNSKQITTKPSHMPAASFSSISGGSLNPQLCAGCSKEKKIPRSILTKTLRQSAWAYTGLWKFSYHQKSYNNMIQNKSKKTSKNSFCQSFISCQSSSHVVPYDIW